MYIDYKECAETMYWLELLHESDILNDQEFTSVYSYCEELKKLLSSITKNTKI